MENKDDQHSKEQPIIIKKVKKGGGHGHHGGAWKVAYADFVTAMMAFFIVMWILASSEEVKQQVAEYFNNPDKFELFSGERKSGPVPVDLELNQGPAKPNQGKSGDSFISFSGDGDNKLDESERDTLIQRFRKEAMLDSIQAADRVSDIASKIQENFDNLKKQQPRIEELLKSVSMELTDEGLRIELLETSENLFFRVGSANLRDEAIEIISVLASEIGKLPNYVEVEGHTDSRPFPAGDNSYTNWELSSDRANAARRILETNGLWEGQIIQVTGFADQKLRNPENPFATTNRRITIMIEQITAGEFLKLRSEAIQNEF
jgi:chemotaxis protein MotB